MTDDDHTAEGEDPGSDVIAHLFDKLTADLAPDTTTSHAVIENAMELVDAKDSPVTASECHGCDDHTDQCGRPDHCCAGCPGNPEED